MEASALQAPHGVARLRSSAGASFLRLRSDEQLVELFRAGHEEAFRVIHDRYRSRLFAYTRQMLPHSRQDAEDALQDVFIRAYAGLRANDRHLALRAWLYRVAHNRCIDHLRKNAPIPTEEIEATSQEVSTDPMAAIEQREDLRKLVLDVQRLPEQQRSALLLRELSGMSYQELADSMELTVPAIKSLLVRARVGLAAAAEARDTACEDIRTEIVSSHERGVRPNALARRHLADCVACQEYRENVRGVSRSFAALVPAAPILLALKLLGVGSVYSAAAYSGSAGGGAGAVAAGSAAGASASAAAGAGAAATAAAGASAAAAGGAGAVAGLASGGVALGSGVVAGGMTAGHLAALIAAAAATAGGAVAVSQQGSAHHHHHLPAYPAAVIIQKAVNQGTAGGISPATAVAPVAPVTPAPTTAAATAGATTLRRAPVRPAAPAGTTTGAASTTAASTSTTPATATSSTTATSGATTTSAGTATGTGAATSTTPASGAATTPINTDSTPGQSTAPGTPAGSGASTGSTGSSASTAPSGSTSRSGSITGSAGSGASSASGTSASGSSTGGTATAPQ